MIAFGAPISANTVEHGQEQYTMHCSGCHGVEGKGGTGLPLSTPSVISTLTDDYIRKTIKYGRPGRIMPAFAHLSEKDVEGIVRYVRTWGESTVPAGYEKIAGNPDSGQPLYQAHCANCHGDDLIGGDGTGITFSRPREHSIMPPALNNQGFLHSVSDNMLKHIIQKGRAGTPMPAFETTLNEQEINDVVAYIRAFEEVEQQDDEEIPPVLTYSVDTGFDETVARIREVLSASNYRVFPDRYLEQGLTDEFSVNKRQKVIRFCNFEKLYEAIRIEPRLGTVLPCKMTIIENEQGEVKILTANIRAQSKLFNNKKLDWVAAEVEKSYAEVLEEVTF
jgi:cytochrome c oxidase cbb3-type subunit 3